MANKVFQHLNVNFVQRLVFQELKNQAFEPDFGHHIRVVAYFVPLHESEGLFGDEIDLIEKIQEIRSKYFATESSKTKEALHQKFVKLLKDQKTIKVLS